MRTFLIPLLLSTGLAAGCAGKTSSTPGAGSEAAAAQSKPGAAAAPAGSGPGPTSGARPTPAGNGRLTLVSRGLAVHASDGDAAAAVDADYNSEWRAAGVPATLAFDLSSLPAAQRQQLLLAWYNDASYGYDHNLVGQPGYNNPGAYTLEANAAAGGAAPPASGWVQLAQVSGNSRHSREHLLDLRGYSWLRMRFSASDGSDGNHGIAINVDLYDAANGVGDGWFFAGDSITANCMGHRDLYGAESPSFGMLVDGSNPPPQENAGIPGWTTTDFLPYLAEWLRGFPGRYVTVNLGSNDAGGGLAPEQFYRNLAQLVQAVLDAGKVPVVPTIPYATSSAHQANIPGLNRKIQELYAAYPAVVRGPDLYAHFRAHPEQLSDGLHPTDEGCAAYRRLWADTARSAVY